MSQSNPKSSELSSTTSVAGQPAPVAQLIEEFTRLPGIGRRSAERMAFHVLKASPEDAMRLSRAIADVKQHVGNCTICNGLTDLEVCRICSSPDRDASILLVVEQPKDLIGLEQVGSFRGVYHVLMGRLDPLGGVEPEDLAIRTLLDRIDDPRRNSREVAVREVIFGLNPNLEGDTTALFLADQLAGLSVEVTRLARGLPAGSQIEYASRAVLSDAIEGRQKM